MTAVPAAAVPSELRGGLILASDGAGISVVLPIPRVPRVPGRGRYPCAQRTCSDLPARSVGGVQTELKPRAPRAGATTGSPDDRVAVVTGGASGIGLTTVRPAAAEPPGGTIRRGPSPRTVLAVAALGGAVAYIDATIVNIAFPDIARSFPGTSLSKLSWVLNRSLSGGRLGDGGLWSRYSTLVRA